MKLIRYENQSGRVGYAAQQDDGDALEIKGDVFWLL